MRVSLSVVLFTTLLLGHFAHSQHVGREERMASGTDVGPGEAPYQASVRLIEADRHLGSGAILNVRFVISQASFIYKLMRQMPNRTLYSLARIRVGQSELKSQANDQFRLIQSCIFHPEFDFELAQNDVALLKTDSPIELNPLVQPIALYRGPIADGSVVQYTDWGADMVTATQDDFKERLQKMDAQAISNERCKELLSAWDLQDFVYDSRVCIYTDGVGSVCTGNVGGPLVIVADGTPQLVGVMTYVYRACNSTVPAGFERMWNHNGWITTSSKINYKYTDLEQTCRVVRNVASQLQTKKKALRLKRAAKGIN
ncbi:trypsin-1-like [Anopheles ziemanni]|uniref:trypsin-1-like n=1 Tax=Anopheles coustani TaxID=139045 RepID=UPI002658448C|nr:trypsin-1-like [Anopheles coustani]XP_058169992.1 trypsin-1-like [Anopheles ziemanni]